MASYDLRCRGCGGDFEVFVQGFLKDEHRVCPECGSREVEQRITGFLKGSSGGQSVSTGCSSHGGFG
jgi:putative FmdB family regulatory protein